MILSLKVKMAKWALPVFWTFHQPNQALRGKGWRRPEWLVSIPDPGFLSWVGWGENGKEGQEVWITLEVEFRNKGTQSVTTTYFSAPDWYGLECVIYTGLSCFLSDAERKAAFTKGWLIFTFRKAEMKSLFGPKVNFSVICLKKNVRWSKNSCLDQVNK